MEFKVFQTRLPAPTRVASEFGPVVVVARLSTHVNHAVDTGAPTQDLAPGIAQRTAMKPRFGLGLVEPIGAGVAYAVQIAHGDVDPVVVVFATGFYEQDLEAGVGTQAVGQEATGRARTHNDVVKLQIVHGAVR